MKVKNIRALTMQRELEDLRAPKSDLAIHYNLPIRITFSGKRGAGKSTLKTLIKHALNKHGIDTVCFRPDNDSEVMLVSSSMELVDA